jgi:hypothetical protein
MALIDKLMEQRAIEDSAKGDISWISDMISTNAIYEVAVRGIYLMVIVMSL